MVECHKNGTVIFRRRLVYLPRPLEDLGPVGALANSGRSNFVAEEYVRIANEADLPPGELLRAEAHGMELCLANIEGQVYAVSNVCPHASWPLDAGYLDGEEIICAGHGMAFNICSDKKLSLLVSPYGGGMKRFPVKVEEGGIWVAEG